jgi:predicted Zn-dependent protease
MRIRTLIGVLVALAFVVLASFLSTRNTELLSQRFSLGDTVSWPLYGVLLVAFLAGFLPPVVVLVVEHFRQELAARRERRLNREAESRRGSFRRAVDYQADGQWAKAAAELESLLAERPEDFGTLLRYGEVLRRSGRFDEAVEIHRRASVLYPRSVALLYELAADYERIGKEDVGHEIRNRIVRDFTGIGLEVRRRRRNAAMVESDWAEAARHQESIESMLRENDDQLELEREREVGLGLAYQRGLQCMEADRQEEARSIFRDVLRQEERFIPASIMLGEAALLAGAEASACAEWKRGYLATGSPVFLQRIEDHFIERERPAEAIETLHELISGADNDLLPRFFLGRLYYRLEMHDEALKVLSGIRDRVASSPTFHLLSGRIRERRGELDLAIISYAESLQQAGLTAAEYRCEVCSTAYGEWRDRCENCGSWNALELDFEEERVSASELGVRERPVWVVVDESEDAVGGDPELASDPRDGAPDGDKSA